MGDKVRTYPSLAEVPTEDVTYEIIKQFCDAQMEEGIDLDYKSDWPNDLERVLCAFANTQGGIVLIGVEEDGKTGRPICPPVGIEGSPEVLKEKARNIAVDAIYPPVTPEVQVCPIPNTPTRSVVFVRVQPTRLMHAVDRRTRIYIRSSSRNQANALASISDLRWLWDQRAGSDKLRETLLNVAHQRSLSPSIAFESDLLAKLWANAPQLSISLLPTFPGQMQRIEPRNLLETVNSLGAISSTWKLVDRQIPWHETKWRGIPDGVALSSRGGHDSFQQYIELGQYAHIHCAISHPPRAVSTLPVPQQTSENCVFAYVLLSYLDIAFRFGAKFYQQIGYRGPLQVTSNLYRVGGLLLEYQLPGMVNVLDQTFLSQASIDSNISLLDIEVNAFDLSTKLDWLLALATDALFWAFGITWSREKVQEWLVKLTS